MNIIILNELKKEPKFYEYLKENSEWIKGFNRGTVSVKQYQNFIKEKYKLRFTDKVTNTIDNVDLAMNVLSAMK